MSRTQPPDSGLFQRLTAPLTPRRKRESSSGTGRNDYLIAAQIAQDISSRLDLDTLVKRLARLSVNSFDVSSSQVFLHDAAEGQLVLAAKSGVGNDLAQLAARAAQLSEPVLVNISEEAPSGVADSLLPAGGSGLAIPLLHGEQLAGVLAMQHDQLGQFDSLDIPVLSALGSQIAVAIDNARRFDSLREAQQADRNAANSIAQHDRFVSALAYVSRDLLRHGLDARDEALHVLGEACGASHVTLYEETLGPQGDPGVQARDEWAAPGSDLAAPAASVDHVAYRDGLDDWRDRLGNHEVILEPVERIPHAQRAALATRAARWVLVLPLFVAESFYGFVVFESHAENPGWGSDIVDLLRWGVDVIGDATASTLTITRTQTTLYHIEQLYRMAQAVMQAREPRTVLDAFLELIPPEGPCDASLYAVHYDQDGEPTEAELLASHHETSRPITRDGTRLRLEALLPDSMLLERPHRIQVFTDTATLNSPLGRRLQAARVGSLAVIPLALAGERWTGLVTLTWPEPHEIDADTEQLYDLVAPQLALAITNLRQPARLAQSEAVLRALVENSPGWVWGKDRQHRYLFANQALAEQGLGVELEAVPGALDSDFLPEARVMGEPDLGIRGTLSDDEAALNGEPVYNPHELVTFADGTPHIMATTRVPVSDSMGQIIGTLGIARDVTEIYAARQREELVYELAQAMSTTTSTVALLRAIIDQLSDAFNDAHVAIYLLEGDNLVVRAGSGEAGRTMTTRRHSVPVDAPRGLVALAARTGSPVVANDVDTHPGYLPNPLLPSTRTEVAVPLQASSRLLGMLDVQQDAVGAFSEADVRMLTAIGYQLASALANALLIRQQRKAADRRDEYDRLRNEFLANVSHELRTPLNAIIGYSELLMSEAGMQAHDAVRANLEAIHASGQHLLAVVNDVIDLARIEANQMVLHREQVELAVLIDQIAADIRVLLRSKPGIDLEIDLPEEPPELEADPARLRQILWHLLNNAIKFTDRGHIRLTCRREGNFVHFVVHDTGNGIPKGQHTAVFEPFRQVDGSATREQGGMGLGLTIVRQLVLLHGGTLEMDSRPGQGTTVTVRLPIRGGP